ncbi:UDP-N-acetylglucosamine 4,6-dehydratase (inverting) [Herbaspirillum frisingense]|uniref:UDP-N-acetylglucosamine 4,6-dehydratase (inverting) n=1 Tax=Herbaspirillum frisingense TaxID=92645 RepID=UPI0039B02B86
MNSTSFLNNKRILVTGGTGSFGMAFTEMLMERYQPRELIIFSRDEFKQSEMAKRWPTSKYPIRYYLGDIRDRERLMRAFVGVDVLVHAAALKQVPALENNPLEAVKTNVIGAQNIIEAALDCDVQRVIGVSTDKAVSPSNLYGATKLAMEKLLVAANNYTRYRDIKFCLVRYGNVLGSRGSVIPLWRDMYLQGHREFPITDPRMTRFLINLEQGVELVFRAIEEGDAGDIFIPKIPSALISDIGQSFPEPTTLRTVGIRPGEKLHESLISEDEGRHTRDLGSHFVIVPEFEHLDSNRHALKFGMTLPEGFTYSSDNNAEWLSADQLKGVIDNYLKV